MTALALHSNPAQRLSWPRIGALSGTMSLHLYAVLLLLTPPVAMQMMRQAQADAVVVHIIEPPPKPVELVEPALPQPKHNEPPPPVQRHHEAIKTVDPPVTTIETPMSRPATDQGGTSDIGSTQDSAPTALTYGTRTTVKYPHDALLRREHGTVILRVLVGADGGPQQVEIETSSGSRSLDNAARDAVRHWSFRPGTRNGVAQSAWARVPIAFDLQQL